MALFVTISLPEAATFAAAVVLFGVDVFAEVGDAVEVLASGVGGSERRWALVPGEVSEKGLVRFGEANHFVFVERREVPCSDGEEEENRGVRESMMA